ncbi:PD-(D/E)XK nuclease superfamily protein [Planctomycetes bacterium Pan216]|uniref:PD-(D/E)XK nuclease superfamily protein n=1 Tax=Kolteria novifilia TaxID=2527975 RepID=A0A518AY04_9BACT|nr:PD-(D/E)XK nuclease superfamily protein [Planctomycetes bacterium Pan216]
MITALMESPRRVEGQRVTGRDYVSWSAINTYRQCSLRYYFKYIEGLPEETVSSSLVFGAAIHACFEHHFNELMAGSSSPGLDDLLEAFWGAWRDRNEEAEIVFAKNEDLEAVRKLALRVLSAFKQSDLANPLGTIIGIEEELRGALLPGVPDLLARVDLLTETSDSLIVTDFKTAKSRWSTHQAEDAGEQLLLYSELAKELAPGKRLRLAFAVITKTTKPVAERCPVSIDADRLTRTRRIVERVWKAIEAGHFFPSPSPIACGSCPYRAPCRRWSAIEPMNR